jgi:biotin transport system substrate-specific component
MARAGRSDTMNDVSDDHRPIAAVLWPPRGVAAVDAVRAVVLTALGVGLLAISAKTNVPLPMVPMTLQTLVVLVIGAAYGWRLGAATVIGYLAVGAAGVPLFAGPTGGLAPLFGATAGFLFGFVVAALITGVLGERGWDRSMVRMFVAMAIGHAVILAMGLLWLAYGRKLGLEKAWAVGVGPFLEGAVAKTLLGALLVPGLRALADRRRTL